ncbi:ureidoglycolate lyase [Hasllibacter sp. MH4015]|uniref:ureidoglycolate lyase n=1 Tax=Hasllibacter sp. MH4015 TaxID=2854029 RepID=UPI001CD63F6A|nr:ureidoglycolate lyase [Hasllibacter sp. MH4015]
MRSLVATAITAEAFKPYGEVIEVGTVQPLLINAGMCNRYTDLATFDIEDGTVGLSLFQATLRDMPYTCDLLERHPLGSQCFIPMSDAAYLVIVAPDDGGRPGPASAFLATHSVAVNLARNTWHGVLAPIAGSGLFAVIDRVGDGPNLEEYRMEEPVLVTSTKR